MRKIIAAVFLSALLVACGSGDQTGEAVAPGSTSVSVETTVTTSGEPGTAPATSTPNPSEPGRLDVTLQEIPLDVEPSGFTQDGDLIWVVSRDAGELLAVDVGAGETGTAFTIGGEPVAVAPAEGSLWVTEHEFGDNVVRRVDPSTGEVMAEVSSSPGTHPLHVVGGGGAVWATISGAEIERIDPATNEVVETISASEISHPSGYGALVFDFGSLWMIDYQSGRLLRIDPADNQITATFEDLGYSAEDLGGGSVGIHATGPAALATTADGLWVLSDTVNPDQTDVAGYGALFLVDPGSEEIVRRVDLTFEPDPSSNPGLVITDGAAWFIEAVDGNIVRVDLTTELEDYIYTGSDLPLGLVATTDMLWSLRYGGLSGIDLAEAAQLAER